MRAATGLLILLAAALPASEIWLGDSLARLGFANPRPERDGSEQFSRAAPAPLSVSAEKDRDHLLVDGIKVCLGDATVLRPQRPRVGPATPRLAIRRLDYDKVLVPLLWGAPPEARRPVRILLDPGHGGRDPGFQNKALRLDEKHLTLETARRVATHLRAAGLEVALTRDRDVFLDLKDRSAMAGRTRADLFVSIHFNAAAATSAAGVETFCLTPAGQHSTHDTGNRGSTRAEPGNRFDALNIRAAYAVQRSLVTTLRSTDRGVKRARFSVLTDLPCPGILVEAAFLSNRAEAIRLSQESHREQVARAIADGILAYAAGLPR
jgi:N-acetylmuramoyl-L-alanine amidase